MLFAEVLPMIGVARSNAWMVGELAGRKWLLSLLTSLPRVGSEGRHDNDGDPAEKDEPAEPYGGATEGAEESIHGVDPASPHGLMRRRCPVGRAPQRDLREEPAEPEGDGGDRHRHQKDDVERVGVGDDEGVVDRRRGACAAASG